MLLLSAFSLGFFIFAEGMLCFVLRELAFGFVALVFTFFLPVSAFLYVACISFKIRYLDNLTTFRHGRSWDKPDGFQATSS